MPIQGLSKDILKSSALCASQAQNKNHTLGIYFKEMKFKLNLYRYKIQYKLGTSLIMRNRLNNKILKRRIKQEMNILHKFPRWLKV